MNEQTEIYINPLEYNNENDSSLHSQLNSPIRDTLRWGLRKSQLLNIWMNKSVGYRWLHSRTALYYKTLDKLFTYPIVIASTLFGMGGFAMIGIAPDYEETPRWEKTLNYVFAMVNLGVAVLVSIQKMSGYAENPKCTISQRLNTQNFIEKLI